MKTIKLKKLSLILAGVALINLTACSTIEIIHEPVGCLGQPSLPGFTEEELSPLSEQTFNKILNTVIIYKSRIESQCEINEAHDEIHN